MKQIWKDFLDKLRELALKSWEQIKQSCKSTLELLKTVCIDFIKGLFNWLKTLIVSICSIVWELIKVIFSLLVASLKSTFGIILEKIISWINHW